MLRNIIKIAMVATILAVVLLLTAVIGATPSAQDPSGRRVEHPSPGVTVIYNPTDDDLDLPAEERSVPICPESIPNRSIPTPSAVQLHEPARCRARIGVIVKHDPNYPLPPGSAPSAMPSVPNSQVGQIPENQANWRWATNEMGCPAGGCTAATAGFNQIYGSITTQIPTLDPGESWNNYHFYNRMHVAHPFYPSPCAGFPFETISTGIGYGPIYTGTFWNHAVMERVVRKPDGTIVCDILSTAQTFDPPGALMFRLYWDGSNWKAVIWLGFWQTIGSVPTRWSQSPRNSVGQEIWAANQNNFGNIHIEVSFIHRIDVQSPQMSTRPWYEGILPAELQGRSWFIADQPFHVMDLLGGDYTAISSKLF